MCESTKLCKAEAKINCSKRNIRRYIAAILWSIADIRNVVRYVLGLIFNFSRKLYHKQSTELEYYQVSP